MRQRNRLLKTQTNLASTATTVEPTSPALTPSLPDPAERTELEAMFCDSVDSTAPSARLDPEGMRQVNRADRSGQAFGAGLGGARSRFDRAWIEIGATPALGAGTIFVRKT